MNPINVNCMFLIVGLRRGRRCRHQYCLCIGWCRRCVFAPAKASHKLAWRGQIDPFRLSDWLVSALMFSVQVFESGTG